MEELGNHCLDVASQQDPDNFEKYRAFLEALKLDATTAQGLVKLILLQQDISSQLVDNLNANVHLRTLLTNLFIIDDIFTNNN